MIEVLIKWWHSYQNRSINISLSQGISHARRLNLATYIVVHWSSWCNLRIFLTVVIGQFISPKLYRNFQIKLWKSSRVDPFAYRHVKHTPSRGISNAKKQNLAAYVDVQWSSWCNLRIFLIVGIMQFVSPKLYWNFQIKLWKSSRSWSSLVNTWNMKGLCLLIISH